jgi:glycosyltransferase involved in cell wall biosynthesis
MAPNLEPETPLTGARAPLVSLVLPVHNGARYLAEALDSILAQSFADFELIAVDDCSSDASPGILADYAAREPRMRVITNARNLKLPASLNAGFRAARGRWFSWTSDDNVLHPDMLAELTAATAAAPAADIYYADFCVIDDDGRVVRRETVAPPEDMVFGNVVGCCFLYRREVDRALGGYDETLFGVEDFDFWLRAARAGFRFSPVRKQLYSYRRHGGSLTDTHSRRIHGLAAGLMLREIAALPRSARRARAYLNVASNDPYTWRWSLVWQALRDDPATVVRQRRELGRWLRYSLGRRLQTALGAGRRLRT